MHGLISATHGRRQRASARRHYRHGWRAAVVRAFTAAGLYLNEQVPTLTAAASVAARTCCTCGPQSS